MSSQMKFLTSLVVAVFSATVLSTPPGEHDHDHHDHHDHDHHDHDHHDHDHHDHHHGELTPEMMEEQAREDFDQMDTEKTGYLTKEKVKEFLNDASADAEVDDFFSKADADSDGKVSFAEYFKFVTDMYEQYQTQAMEEVAGESFNFGELDEMIASMQNGDGKFDDDWDDDDNDDHAAGHDEEL